MKKKGILQALCAVLSFAFCLCYVPGAYAAEADVVQNTEVVEESFDISEQQLNENEITTCAVMSSGTCGTNARWTLDQNGVLTISGSGEINSTPWQKAEVYELIISDGITSIGKRAFSKHYNIETISLGNTVQTIGEYAFEDCYDLRTLYIPSSVKTIGTEAFRGCSDLRSLTVNAGTLDIGDRAFMNCESMTSVSLSGKCISSIGEGAFIWDNKISSLKVTAKVEDIFERAFQSCSSLTSVSFPDGLHYLASEVFYECTKLSKISIPSSVYYIGSDVFRQTPWLAAQGDFVVIGDILVKYQGSSSYVRIPDKIRLIGGGAFAANKSVVVVDFPNTVQMIGSEAFVVCSNLATVFLPDSLQNIQPDAFAGCNIQEINIPKNVTSIGSRAFRGQKLRNIYFFGDAPYFSDDTFIYQEDVTAYYPRNNSTWTRDVRQDYYGDIYWEEWDCHRNVNVVNCSDVTKTASTSAFSFNLGATTHGGAKLSYSSNNSSITVDKNGKVTVAKNYAGKATITVKANDTSVFAAWSKKVTVTIKKKAQPMKVSPATKSYKQSVVKKKAQSFSIKTENAQGKVTYKSSNKKYVTVSDKGKVKIAKKTPKGKYKITVTAAGKGIYSSGSKTVTITVK